MAGVADISLGNTLKFVDHKDDGNFSGSGKRISITMTTAWRCAPCQRMRRIQITQWSGCRACNLLAKIEFRCGWLRWREWAGIVFITLGSHEAGIRAKHPSLTLPAPNRGEPSRHLGSSYQQGVPILSPLIADLSGLWGSSMQVMHGRPQGLSPRWPGG